jgi:hypothetical protein
MPKKAEARKLPRPLSLRTTDSGPTSSSGRGSTAAAGGRG